MPKHGQEWPYVASSRSVPPSCTHASDCGVQSYVMTLVLYSHIKMISNRNGGDAGPPTNYTSEWPRSTTRCNIVNDTNQNNGCLHSPAFSHRHF